MWYPVDPKARLYVARSRQRELQDGVRESRRRRASLSTFRPERVHGICLRLGRFLIVIGQTIYDEERSCPDVA